MIDFELRARLEQRIQMAAHLERVRTLHEAQKAGLTGSSLFVAVRRDYPPEPLERTAQFIEENSP